MNITELDSYRLSDAVKFHNRLNPKLWGRDEHLLPEVRDKLMEIAADFQEFLGVSDLDVEDITISGSNAAFSYTPHSDIDLHLVVRKPAEADEVYQELFNAKKYQYNDMHDIRIHGADVELYVQDAEETPVSLGEYSVKNGDWIQVPKKKRAQIDQSIVKHKYEDLRARIKSALKEDSAERIAALIAKIKAMRQTGLDQHGEFGPENLAFKILRKQGLIKQLYDAQAAARDRELSLQERNRPKARVRYGFMEVNTGMAQGSAIGDNGAQSTWDGVSPDTDETLTEDNNENIVQEFIASTAERLGIESMPRIELHRDADWSKNEQSFGMYEPSTHTLHVNMANRHLMDILRTTAHELTHCRQHELSPLPDNAGDTGSRWENQAHATAGVIMRDYADAHPELFEKDPVVESSGYIPTAAEKNDPRFKMALSPDVKPGATGLNANKMALKTDSQGKPSLLIKGLKNALREFKETGRLPGSVKEMDSLGNQDVTGPETPPTMPKGTVRVDVSDLYDWYKLGQHISNMKGLGKHDFGQGAPSAIVSFGDEDTEHRYIKDLEATGLDVTDIDPRDPNQPPGMRKIKTDPTYNVAESADEELSEDQLNEIRMSTASLRAEAAKTGAQAGMEFEMIVPNASVDSEPEYERDDDMDRRSRSFQDIENFFDDGDYNGRGDIRRLMERLQEDYMEWKMEQTSEAWEDEGVDYMRDYIDVNDLFDREEALDEARDEVMTANPDLSPESEDFQQLVNARINELQEQFVLEEYEKQGRIYNDAFETFSEEKNDDYDESNFLEDARYRYMSDVESTYDITWPYYYDVNAGNDGDADVDQIADDFSNSIGKPVNASSSYHGARREAGHYVVEPDGSLEGDNPGDAGLEFVSPPMPIDELLSDLNKVKAWADREGCYTNDSTGLHINISVPNYSLEKLDYVKLALLMGDEYVLELFGRSGNHYAKAATGKIKTALQQKPEAAAQIMDMMRGHMADLATKAIHTGTTDKYTSINTKNGYIEFRSPGGDWLDANFDKIENTLLRFTVALSAAINPEAYRKEYLKKLYKLLESSQAKGGPDVLQLFANYSAGELDKAALIRQVRQQQLARNVAKGKNTGKMWWSVSRPGYFASIEVVASSREEAIDKAIEPGNYPDWARAKNTLEATPVRPYEEKKPTGPTLNGRPSNPDGDWVITDARASGVPVYRFMASGSSDAFNVLQQWEAANPDGEWKYVRDVDQRLGQPGAPAQPAAANQGNWGIWIDGRQSFSRLPGTHPAGQEVPLRRFPTQQAAADWLESHRQENVGVRSDIEVREIEPAAPVPGSTPATSNLGVFTGEWKIINVDTGQELHRFGGVGNVQSDANGVALDWIRRNAPYTDLVQIEVVPVMGAPVPGSTLDLQRQRAAQAGQFQEPGASRGDLTPRGPGPWEIYRISDGSSVRPLDHTNRQAAETEARTALGFRAEAPELYGVRTRQSADAAHGGVVDVAGEQPATAPRTLTTPGQAQQQWTGAWLVLNPEGRVLQRFTGIGNAQADANRHAMNWLRSNPRHMQTGVTVAPEMA